MKVMVFGCKSMKGTSKVGNKYEMTRLYVASEISPVSNDKMSLRGSGFEAAEIECDHEAFQDFEGLRFPCTLDLKTDFRMVGGKLVPVVIGLEADKKQPASA